MAAAAVLALALWLPARAEDAEAAFRACRDAEAALDYAAAAVACASCRDLDPTGPRATRCAGRAEWIEARRDPNGAFAGLVALQEVRRDYRTLGGEAAAERVRALWDADGRRPAAIGAVVRAEAGLWLARKALDDGDPEVALAYTTALQGGDWPSEVHKPLAGLHAEALARSGRPDEARAVQEPRRGSRTSVVDVLARERRRDALATTSWGGVVLFALVGVPLALRGWVGRPAGRGAGPAGSRPPSPSFDRDATPTGADAAENPARATGPAKGAGPGGPAGSRPPSPRFDREPTRSGAAAAENPARAPGPAKGAGPGGPAGSRPPPPSFDREPTRSGADAAENPARAPGPAKGSVRGMVPLLVAFAGAGLIAEGWEAGAGRAVPWLALVGVAVHAVAAGAQAGVAGPARGVVGALAAWATIGGSFLVLRATGGLDWIGL